MKRNWRQLVLTIGVACALFLGRQVLSAGSPAEEWPIYTSPQYGFSLSYPPDWKLQPDTDRDFGFRISSPDLTTDPIGRPEEGGYLSVRVLQMEAEAVDSYGNYFFPNPAQSYRQAITVGDSEGKEIGGIDVDGTASTDRLFHRDGFLFHFRFVHHDMANRSTVDAGLQALATARPGHAPPLLPAEPAPDQSTFLFPSLKLAFPADAGRITAGYDIFSHYGGDDYALDYCQGAGCGASQIGAYVTAPTDLTLVWSGRGFGMPEDSEDFHILEITNDGNSQLCLSLAHFAIELPGFEPGTRVSQGAVLGRLVDYLPSAAHIHMGVWTTPGTGCAGGSRTALPYTGQYQLDGVDYPANGTDYALWPLVSTNQPTCVEPASDGTTPSGQPASDPGDCLPSLDPLITAISVGSGQSYQLAHCALGDHYYVDRDYTLTGFSVGALDGLACLKTANADKEDASADLLAFNLRQPARIYLYYDPRTVGEAPWMAPFAGSPHKAYVSDEAMGYFAVRACDSPPGPVVLGGPRQGEADGNGAMYWLAFEPLASGAPPYANCSSIPRSYMHLPFVTR